MADNVQLNSGTGGDIAAADDIGGVKFQRVKCVLGADGTNDGDISKTNPMPSREVTPNADTGLTSIPTSLTAVPSIGAATAIALIGVHVCNPSGAAITFSLTDGGGTYLIYQEQIAARGHLTLPFFRMPVTGLKWLASGNGLVGKAWGTLQ